MTPFDFTFTVDQLNVILTGNDQIPEWFQALSDALPNYDISTISRVSAFISQCAYESKNFCLLHENLNYQASSLIAHWPGKFNSANVYDYAHNQEKIANYIYSNRLGNGPVESGDGWTFKGRGLIQITGRANYANCSQFLFQDDRLVSAPESVEQDMDVAVGTACWFWHVNNLNPLADSANFVKLTRMINGGTNGLSDRIEKFHQVINIINQTQPDE
jgi:putative chitinase